MTLASASSRISACLLPRLLPGASTVAGAARRALLSLLPGTLSEATGTMGSAADPIRPVALPLLPLGAV